MALVTLLHLPRERRWCAMFFTEYDFVVYEGALYQVDEYWPETHQVAIRQAGAHGFRVVSDNSLRLVL